MKKLFLVAAILAAISTQHASAEGSLSIVISSHHAGDCRECGATRPAKIQFSTGVDGAVASSIVESTGSKNSDERVAMYLESNLADLFVVKPGTKYAPITVLVSWFDKFNGCLVQLPNGPIIDTEVRCGQRDMERLQAAGLK